MTKGRSILCLLKTRLWQSSLTTSTHIVTIAASKARYLVRRHSIIRKTLTGKLMKNIGAGYERRNLVTTKGSK